MVTYTRKQMDALLMSHAPIPFDWDISDEVRIVSIQIVDAANPAARQELRERISSLLGSHAAALTADPAPEGMVSDTVKQFNEQLKGLYHALTGYSPTADELSALGGHNTSNGSEN